MPTPIPSPVEIEVNAPLAHTFDITVTLELTKVIYAKGLLPGVKSISTTTMKWNAVGDSRRLHMSDGSSATETLTTYEKDQRIAYRVDDFKGPMKFLVSHSTGEWRFTPKGEGKTHVQWTFTFHPRSAMTAPIVRFVAKRLWPGYAGAALERVKGFSEAESAKK